MFSAGMLGKETTNLLENTLKLQEVGISYTAGYYEGEGASNSRVASRLIDKIVEGEGLELFAIIPPLCPRLKKAAYLEHIINGIMAWRKHSYNC